MSGDVLSKKNDGSKLHFLDYESLGDVDTSKIKLSVFCIVLNGMPFLPYAIKAVYDEAYEIIVVEGAVEKCTFAADADGGSIDGTVNCLNSLADPQNKVKVIRGNWKDKLEMTNVAISKCTGSYVLALAADEVYRRKDLQFIKKILVKNPEISQIDFIPHNFWKGFDYIFWSSKFEEEVGFQYARVFKLEEGAFFEDHRPPVVKYCDGTRSNERLRIDGTVMKELGITLFHYSYVFDAQVKQKIDLYNKFGWGKAWGVDFDHWYREGFLKWTSQNREIVESHYPPWAGDRDSKTVLFEGVHPEAIKNFIEEYKELYSIGKKEVLNQVLKAWKTIELDAPLVKRRCVIEDHIKWDQPFWNNHVALAYSSKRLKPKSYLEVGCRTGGSMSQVLFNHIPENIVAVDCWEGSYAGYDNTLPYFRKQMNALFSHLGQENNIKVRKGNSHSVMKRLILEGKKFQLITIDGDHSEEGAWEDLLDAMQLLDDVGAIVFDDIVHAQFSFLLDVAYRLLKTFPYLDYVINTQQDNGCVVFLKGMSKTEFLDSNRKKDVFVASDMGTGDDFTAVGDESEFASVIKKLIASVRPNKIIETGTYLGNGTTKIIAEALKENLITDAKFYTIEVNPDNYSQAQKNFKDAGVDFYVRSINGLSVPRELLPSKSKIQDSCVDDIEFEEIFVDHEADKRVDKYYSETNYPNVEDNCLGKLLKQFDNRVDFVLLDSAGHMGFVEFCYLVERLKGQCYIALDDIYHIKHHKSFKYIQEDDRFEIISSSHEKFGFCLVKFTPLVSLDSASIKDITFIRCDAIGDAVLFASSLKYFRSMFSESKIRIICQDYVAPVYDNCPYIDEIYTIDRIKIFEDINYRDKVYKDIRVFNTDCVINSTYSRNPFFDEFVRVSEAKYKIGYYGDLSNIDQSDFLRTNNYYTDLIYSAGSFKQELERHSDFMKALNIDNVSLKPEVWITEQEKEDIKLFCKKNNIDLNNCIGLFSGAQSAYRTYHSYSDVLIGICLDKKYGVIALGSQDDYATNQRNISELSSQRINVYNLSGKLTLRQSFALVSLLDCVIGSETGLAHVACALDIPNVVLLGGGHFGRFMPYSKRTVAVSLPLDCFNCNWDCKYSECYCISKLDSKVIREALSYALEKTSDHPCICFAGEDSFSLSDAVLFLPYVLKAFSSVEVKMNWGFIPDTESIKKIAQLEEENSVNLIRILLSEGKIAEADRKLNKFIRLYPCNLDHKVFTMERLLRSENYIRLLPLFKDFVLKHGSNRKFKDWIKGFNHRLSQNIDKS